MPKNGRPEKRLPVTLRLAGPDDAALVAALFSDLFAHYYKAEAPDPEAVRCYVAEAVMTAGPAVEIAIAEIPAESGGEAVGFATFTQVHPGRDLRGQIVLKDLYVTAGGRGRQVGPQILQYLAKLTLARNCSRMDWTSETTNPRALAFYDRLGARREEEKIWYRLDGEALKAVAEKGQVD